MRRERLHLLVRWTLITASLSVLLFLAAGTTQVASIRRYLMVFSALLLITMLAVDPRLAKEPPSGSPFDVNEQVEGVSDVALDRPIGKLDVALQHTAREAADCL